MRKGDETSGSTGLRVPRALGEQVPALFFGGAISRLCNARLNPVGFSSIGVVEMVDRPKLLSCSVLDMGEVPVWYDSGTASGGESIEPLQRRQALRNVEQIVLL
jgi:hypothetical protein